MRKRILFLGTIFLLTACTSNEGEDLARINEKISAYEQEIVTMRDEDNAIIPEIIVNNDYISVVPRQINQISGIFEVTNKTGEDLAYGRGYTLKEKVSGEWQEMELNYHVGFTSEALTLFSGGTAELNFNWDFAFGELLPGTYQISQRFYPADAAFNHETMQFEDEFILTIEFTLTEENIVARDTNTPVQITEIISINYSEGKFQFTNMTENQYSFDHLFGLEKKVDGRWRGLEWEENLSFPDVPLIIRENETMELTADWGYQHGELDAGQYRLRVPFRYIIDDMSQEWFEVLHEFTID